jgi:lipoprotein-releasing system permease protein
VWGDYKWDNIKEYLTAGKLPDFSKDVNEDVLISQFLANRLKLKSRRCVQHFFMKEGQSKLPNIRRFKIVGIFNSGFQFDATYVLEIYVICNVLINEQIK